METITIKGIIIKRISELRGQNKDTKTIAKMISAEFPPHFTEKFVKKVITSDKYRKNKVILIKEGIEYKYQPDAVLIIGEKQEVTGEIKIILSMSCPHCYIEEDLQNDVPLEERRVRPHIIKSIEDLKSTYGGKFKVTLVESWLEWGSDFKDEDELMKYGTYKNNSLLCWRLGISWFPSLVIYGFPSEGGRGKIIPFQVRQGISSHHLIETVKYIVENRPLPKQPIPAKIFTTKYKGKKSEGYKFDPLMDKKRVVV